MADISLRVASTAAIQTKSGIQYMFYGKIHAGDFAYIKGPADPKTGFFKQRTLLVDGDTLKGNPKNPQIAAVYWLDSEGKDQIRLYYVDNFSYLREIVSSDGNDWTVGDLDQKKIMCNGDGPLTAACTGSNITIFYDQIGNDYMNYTTSDGGWKPNLQANNKW